MLSVQEQDVELRLVDPVKNRFRLYGLTECRTLFGELCLRIVWGRIGNRRLRERSEVFADRASLMKRRDELLGRRRRHGYVSASTPRAAARARATERRADVPPRTQPSHPSEMARAVVEDHGLRVDDGVARRLVAAWRDATLGIVEYLKAKGLGTFDFVDASTLAALFVEAAGV